MSKELEKEINKIGNDSMKKTMLKWLTNIRTENLPVTMEDYRKELIRIELIKQIFFEINRMADNSMKKTMLKWLKNIQKQNLPVTMEEYEKERDKYRGSTENRCNFGRIAQSKDTCWFNAIINMILLSDDIKKHLAAITQEYLENDNKKETFLDINSRRFFEDYNEKYNTPTPTSSENINSELFKEMLAYIYYLLYDKKKGIKDIDKDIAAIILNYILPNTPFYQSSKLNTNFTSTEMCFHIDGEIKDQIYMFITKTLLVSNYILYNFFLKNYIELLDNDTVDKIRGESYSNEIYNYELHRMLEKQEIYKKIEDLNSTNELISCTIDIYEYEYTYTYNISAFEYTDRSDENILISAHVICGFICEGKKYIFDSSGGYDNIIYNSKSNAKNLRVIECDWTNLENIKRPDNFLIEYSLLLYKIPPPPPSPPPPLLCGLNGCFASRRSIRVEPAGGSKKKVKKISKKSKKNKI